MHELHTSWSIVGDLSVQSVIAEDRRAEVWEDQTSLQIENELSWQQKVAGFVVKCHR